MCCGQSGRKIQVYICLLDVHLDVVREDGGDVAGAGAGGVEAEGHDHGHVGAQVVVVVLAQQQDHLHQERVNMEIVITTSII